MWLTFHQKYNQVGTLLGDLALCDHVQRESQNNNAFESVYTFQDLDMPDAARIRGLESLLGTCHTAIPLPPFGLDLLLLAVRPSSHTSLLF